MLDTLEWPPSRVLGLQRRRSIFFVPLSISNSSTHGFLNENYCGQRETDFNIEFYGEDTPKSLPKNQP